MQYSPEINYAADAQMAVYAEHVREIMRDRTGGSSPKAFVRTYGCQLNVSDSEHIKGVLCSMGFELTEDQQQADFILFNTCAVREHAEDRVFGNAGALKNLKSRKKSLILAICGCMTQQQHVVERICRSFTHINIVFGTRSAHKLPQLLYEYLTTGSRVIDTDDQTDGVVENMPVHRDGSFKAFVPIMYGCNNFCTYCIVPDVRGRERSRRSGEIINEVKGLVAGGYKEIMLLGQNVNSYGKGLDEHINFAELLQRLCDIEGDFKLRFMTSHPKDATRELFDTMAANGKICKHIHLPFQSGDNEILRRMNRGYTREKYLGLIEYAKSVMPGLSITSDVIVGFPGETYEQFQNTLSLIKQVDFTSLYTFIFSPRKGTPAEKMDDPVPYDEKSRRFSELLRLQEQIANAHTTKMEGSVFEVLAEEIRDGEVSGRSEGNVVIQFPGDESLIGKYVNVEVTATKNWIAKGRLAGIN